LLAPLFGARDLIPAGGPDNPAPAAIAALAARRGLPSRDAPPPAPLYLRLPDARLP
jgi:hypothetical protein